MAVPKRLLTERVPNQALPTEADLHRLAYEADLRLVTRTITHLRNDVNMTAYEAKFPAAVAVRDRLGHARWEDLERFRQRMATFCVQSRRLDRERRQLVSYAHILIVPNIVLIYRAVKVARESLDMFLPRMRAWILREFGQSEVERFEQAHAVRNAGHAAEMRRWFHHNPTLWLVYNQYFAAGERMDTQQQMQWVLWTLQHPQKPCVHEPSVVWDLARAEVYQTLMLLPSEYELRLGN